MLRFFWGNILSLLLISPSPSPLTLFQKKLIYLTKNSIHEGTVTHVNVLRTCFFLGSYAKTVALIKLDCSSNFGLPRYFTRPEVAQVRLGWLETWQLKAFCLTSSGALL